MANSFGRVNKPFLSRVCIVLLLFGFGTSPDFFLSSIDDRNFLLIYLMFIATILFVFSMRVYKSDLLLLFFLASMFFSSIVFNSDSFRSSSIFYTVMFSASFMFYKSCISLNYYTLDSFVNCVRVLIFLYVGILVAQQICVLIGLPVVLAGNYNPNFPWKLSSISAEPAHASINVTVLIFGYVKCRELILRRQYSLLSDGLSDKLVWFSYLWFIGTSNSLTAIFLALVLCFKFVQFKNSGAILLLSLMVLPPFLLLDIDIGIVDRVSRFIPALISLDPEQMIASDHSGSYRFVPAMIIASKVSVLGVQGWFGHGMGYVASFLFMEMPGTPEGYSTGGILILWLEYGLLSFLLFVSFCFSAVAGKSPLFPIFLVFIILFTSNGINTQTVWFSLIILWTVRHFSLMRCEP